MLLLITVSWALEFLRNHGKKLTSFLIDAAFLEFKYNQRIVYYDASIKKNTEICLVKLLIEI